MLRAIDKWLAGYLESLLRRPCGVCRPLHLMFCVADHFEPLGRGVTREEGMGVVARWVDEYPARFAEYRDAGGGPPRHTFFYPAEEYDPECLDRLASLCRQGYGEVEIHLHHRNDTAQGLRACLCSFRDTLHGKHGLLGTDSTGAVRYGFVHGNWALCNSRPDGDWCGVNEELGVLRDTGCYADFTFPSAPSPTQPRLVNAIYHAADRPGKPRGHDRGTRVCVNAPSDQRSGDARSSLMLVTGPLALNWRRRKLGILPRLENGAITGVNPIVPERIRLWARRHIHVVGRPEWVFVKVHTHGGLTSNADVLLGESMCRAHEFLCREYGNGNDWLLHYVTAREMFNIIRAAEDGKTGNPEAYRDYVVRSKFCAAIRYGPLDELSDSFTQTIRA